MIKKIKLILSIAFIVCLTLPVSQCSRERLPNNETQEPIITMNYVWGEKGSNDIKVVPAAVLLIPFILGVFGLFKDGGNALRVFELLSGLGVLVVASWHVLIAKLVLGGYILMVSCVCYLGLCIADFVYAKKEKGPSPHKVKT